MTLCLSTDGGKQNKLIYNFTVYNVQLLMKHLPFSWLSISRMAYECVQSVVKNSTFALF
jgi:hypothetical protein